MSGYNTIAEVRLSAHHKRTGKTVHRLGSEVLPAASLLRIAQLEGEPGYYLLHFDVQGNEMTDTLHDSLSSAMEQAEWEYGVREAEWALSS